MTDPVIPWSELSCNYGHHTSEHVPKAVRTFFSAVLKKTRMQAYWNIENHIVTQGFIDESAPYALTLVLDEVSKRFPKIPDDTYELLYELSDGSSDYAIRAGSLAGQSVEEATKKALQPFIPWLKKRLALGTTDYLSELIHDTIANINEA